MDKKQDMGVGSIKKHMLQMAIPAVSAQLVNMFYNIVDRIFIGHLPEIGGSAFTGVGLFSPIIMLLTAFAMLASSGGAPRAAIAMGRGDKEEAEKILGNCFSLLLFMTVVLTAVFYITCPMLLEFFGGSADTIPYGLEYGRIYILGSVFVLLVMGLNTFITTQGFAAFSMLTTVIGAVINIFLDPILMFAFDMGVAGAAWASIISQAISAIWILIFLTGKKTHLKLKISNMRPSANILLPCLTLGSSSFVMISTESFLAISFSSSLARFGGDVAVGAMTSLNSINQLISMPISGICQGGQPLISYNFGAKKFDRVKEAFLCQFLSCTLYSLGFWLITLLFPNFLCSIFTSDTALVEYSSWAIRIFLACGFSIGFQMSCQQAFIALGQAKTSLLLACLRKIILLIPLIFILPFFFEDKVFAVFLAEPVSDLLAAAITTVIFLSFFNNLLNQNGVKLLGGKS